MKTLFKAAFKTYIRSSTDLIVLQTYLKLIYSRNEFLCILFNLNHDVFIKWKKYKRKLLSLKKNIVFQKTYNWYVSNYKCPLGGSFRLVVIDLYTIMVTIIHPINSVLYVIYYDTLLNKEYSIPKYTLCMIRIYFSCICTLYY